jgi:hypothetical protein
LQFSAADYRRLAVATAFTRVTERDITVNTLPTYRYLRKLARQQARIISKSAVLETLAAEIASRLALLNYMVYGFKKN